MIHSEKEASYFPVDIHWNLRTFKSIHEQFDVNRFFQRAVTVTGPYLTLKTLHPADALIYCSLHLLLNHPDALNLKWLFDLKFLADSLAIPNDWEKLQEWSVETRARIAVERCLRLAQFWTGLAIPDQFNDFTVWPKPGKMETALIPYLVTVNQGVQGEFQAFRSALSYPMDNAYFLFRLMVPPIDYMRGAYPLFSDCLLPLSYMQRWIRWISPQCKINKSGTNKAPERNRR